MDLRAEKLSYLKSLLNSNQWTNVSSTDQLVTQKLNIPDSDICVFRSYGVINLNADDLINTVIDVYSSLKNIKKYDPDITQYEIIREYTDGMLCRQINTLSWPLWPRESVYLQFLEEEGNTSYLYMYSLPENDSDNFPVDPNCVRTNITISGYVIEKLDDKCILQRIAHVDPCGAIPNFVINSYAEKTSSMIKLLQS